MIVWTYKVNDGMEWRCKQDVGKDMLEMNSTVDTIIKWAMTWTFENEQIYGHL